MICAIATVICELAGKLDSMVRVLLRWQMRRKSKVAALA